MILSTLRGEVFKITQDMPSPNDIAKEHGLFLILVSLPIPSQNVSRL